MTPAEVRALSVIQAPGYLVEEAPISRGAACPRLLPRGCKPVSRARVGTLNIRAPPRRLLRGGRLADGFFTIRRLAPYEHSGAARICLPAHSTGEALGPALQPRPPEPCTGRV